MVDKGQAIKAPGSSSPTIMSMSADSSKESYNAKLEASHQRREKLLSSVTQDKAGFCYSVKMDKVENAESIVALSQKLSEKMTATEQRMNAKLKKEAAHQAAHNKMLKSAALRRHVDGSIRGKAVSTNVKVEKAKGKQAEKDAKVDKEAQKRQDEKKERLGDKNANKKAYDKVDEYKERRQMEERLEEQKRMLEEQKRMISAQRECIIEQAKRRVDKNIKKDLADQRKEKDRKKRTDLEGVDVDNDVDNDVEDDPAVANSGSEDQLQLRQASSSDMKDSVLNDTLETTDGTDDDEGNDEGNDNDEESSGSSDSSSASLPNFLSHYNTNNDTNNNNVEDMFDSDLDAAVQKALQSGDSNSVFDDDDDDYDDSSVASSVMSVASNTSNTNSVSSVKSAVQLRLEHRKKPAAPSKELFDAKLQAATQRKLFFLQEIGNKRKARLAKVSSTRSLVKDQHESKRTAHSKTLSERMSLASQRKEYFLDSKTDQLRAKNTKVSSTRSILDQQKDDEAAAIQQKMQGKLHQAAAKKERHRLQFPSRCKPSLPKSPSKRIRPSSLSNKWGKCLPSGWRLLPLANQSSTRNRKKRWRGMGARGRS